MSLRVLFVGDQFADARRSAEERHPGGAELTDAAAIEACPFVVDTRMASEVREHQLDGYDLHVIGNAATAPSSLIEALCRRGRHVLFEHDLRICLHRGNYPAAPDLVHRDHHRCLCPFPRMHQLFSSARGVIYLTRRQRAHYGRNPWFRGPFTERGAVLGSSLMDQAFLRRVERGLRPLTERDIDTVVVHSVHPIKGFEEALEYCRERQHEPHIIRDLAPEEVLDTLARARRLVYLPIALEAAGRLLLEARFLGCEIVSNDHVGVCGEPWWALPEREALERLRDAPARFWRLVAAFAAEPPQQRPRSAWPRSWIPSESRQLRWQRQAARVATRVVPAEICRRGRRAQAERARPRVVHPLTQS